MSLADMQGRRYLLPALKERPSIVNIVLMNTSLKSMLLSTGSMGYMLIMMCLDIAVLANIAFLRLRILGF
jgi:hypothetical protein